MLESPYRNDFPLLKEGQSSHFCQKPLLAYLDNAATTQKPSAVIKAAEGLYRTCNANPYRGTYNLSVQATKLYECSRYIVADFIGAHADEVVFTRNTTESLNIVAYAYALAQLAPGDEVVIPISEHHSNLVPWQQVCKRTGARLVYLTVDPNGRLYEQEIREKINSKTKIVALAHVSNVLGVINPVKEITRHAHDQGAVVVLDCAQSIAHRPLGLHDLGVDFAAFSGHKMYAPMGIGVLYARKELLQDMQPFLFGGEMIDDVREQDSTFEVGPKRFEAGTPNVSGAVGLATAIDYLGNIGYETIGNLERDLTEYLLEGLGKLDNVEIYGCSQPDADRVGVVAFNVKGVNPTDASIILDEANIAIRAGSHCAQPLLRRLGIEACCRVSTCFYNDFGEIDRLLDTLEHMRRSVSKRIMASFP